MQKALIISAAGLALASFLLIITPAIAKSCKENLAELDQRLATSKNVDNPSMTVIKTWRDQAAQFCASGNEAAANARMQPINMMLDTQDRQTMKAQKKVPQGMSVEQLTADYMKGHWCSTSAASKARYEFKFDAKGTWGYYQNGQFYNRGALKYFWDRYGKVTSKSADRFSVSRSRVITDFKRGRCN